MTQQRKTSTPADRWRFFRDAANNWRWKYIMQGKAVAQAYAGFAQYGDCVADAKAHGYREPVRREA